MEFSNVQYGAIQTILKADASILNEVANEQSDIFKTLINDIKANRAELEAALGDLKMNYDSYLQIHQSRKIPENRKTTVERARLLHALDILVDAEFYPFLGSTVGVPGQVDSQATSDWLQTRGDPRAQMLASSFATFFHGNPADVHKLMRKLRDGSDEAEFSEEERRNIEILGLLERMEADYRKELDRLEFYELVDENTRIPTFREIINTFSPEDLRSVIKNKFQDPKLILAPPVSFRKCVASMNAHKTMSGDEWQQDDVEIIDYAQEEIYKDDHETQGPKVWKAFLVEGAREINSDTQGFIKNFNADVSRVAEDFSKEFKDMNRWLGAHLMMTGLMEGEPFRSFVLSGDPILSDPSLKYENRNGKMVAICVPLIYWQNGMYGEYCVTFGACSSVDTVAGNEFRRSVGGDVKMN